MSKKASEKKLKTTVAKKAQGKAKSGAKASEKVVAKKQRRDLKKVVKKTVEKEKKTIKNVKKQAKSAVEKTPKKKSPQEKKGVANSKSKRKMEKVAEKVTKKVTEVPKTATKMAAATSVETSELSPKEKTLSIENKIKEAQDKAIKRLITAGRRKGFLTQTEILEFFPEAEESLELLDELYDKLISAKVDVFDVEADKGTYKLDEKLDPTKLSLDKGTAVDPVRMYLKEIGKSNLLKADEEVSLARKIEAGRYLRITKDWEKEKGKKATRAQLAEEMILDLDAIKEIEKYAPTVTKTEYLKAEKKLTESNLRLVVSIAKRYMGRGLSFSDLIQEGNIGLMKAVEKFDWRRGFKFSTYATWWIRQAITRAIADQARTIRIPVHMIETIHKYKKIARELEQEMERPPKPKEVAKRMGIDAEKAKSIVKIMQETASLEKTVGKDADSTLKEFIEDESVTSPFESASHELLKGHIDEVLGTLNDREKKVLELRFGLRDGRNRTLEEVGKEFGVTRERIRQIEAKALRKLRHPSRSKRLKDYLE